MSRFHPASQTQRYIASHSMAPPSSDQTCFHNLHGCRFLTNEMKGLTLFLIQMHSEYHGAESRQAHSQNGVFRDKDGYEGHDWADKQALIEEFIAW
ncbi:hypothetical protein IF2G_04477 [Cordyceps javanica]|nr:hypothetical protein IF2G_04477 [Cordyceps javanica]